VELIHIGVFTVFGLLYLLVLPARWRTWALFIGSILAIYWLQPTLNIRWLDYSLPTATLAISVLGWLITQQPQEGGAKLAREDWVALGVMTALVLSLTLTRYITIPVELTSRPPETWQVALCLLGLVSVIFALRRRPIRTRVITVGLFFLVCLFIVLKTDGLSRWLSSILRTQTGQDVALASSIDIQWLGFSYVAFRLIHMLRDRQNGLLPNLRLREYLTYVIFFPAYAAGPIDRVERFSEDYRHVGMLDGNRANFIALGFTRITIGLFKKFVVADSLAFFSLSAMTFGQAQSTGAVWVMLYSYALRLYFDFSGYSDIAIGIGILFGIQLPENFDRPYLKNNITAFWQSWHMTLSNWVRFYVYSPLSRALLKRKNKPHPNVIILICTVSTMLVIGLWHGVTLPFALWGLWHSIGLFVHKLWSDRTRKWYRELKQHPRLLQLWQVTGVLLTFHFVLLGWVWFALPDIEATVRAFGMLMGAVR